MNNSIILIALAGAAMSAASPALADEGKAPAAKSLDSAAGSSAPAADTQRYCVVSKITGSYIDRRECHTRAEWLKRNFDPLAPRN